jgi:hypothetical protein
VSKPTQKDWDKLERVSMYLNGCPSLEIVLKASEGLRVLTSVNASFATHPDMKSHTGGMITLGSGPEYVFSKKQSLVAKSSADVIMLRIQRE